MSIAIGKEKFKATLKAKLLELGKNEDSDKKPEEAIDEFLVVLSDELEAWLNTVQVTTTVVGASATGGPVTGTGTGKLI